MLITTLLIAVLSQQPAGASKMELPVLKAGLGSCSADFTVTDADGKPVNLAIVHVKIRYGAMGIKRMDLEVSTNAEGKARVEGLPAKARPLVYDIQKDNNKIVAQQNLAKECQKTHTVVFK
jgi:hypothetical protein